MFLVLNYSGIYERDAYSQRNRRDRASTERPRMTNHREQMRASTYLFFSSNRMLGLIIRQIICTFGHADTSLCDFVVKPTHDDFWECRQHGGLLFGLLSNAVALLSVSESFLR